MIEYYLIVLGLFSVKIELIVCLISVMICFFVGCMMFDDINDVKLVIVIYVLVCKVLI